MMYIAASNISCSSNLFNVSGAAIADAGHALIARMSSVLV